MATYNGRIGDTGFDTNLSDDASARARFDQSETEGNIKSSINNLKGDVSGLARSVAQVGKDRLEAAKVSARSGLEKFEASVRERPFVFVGGALLIGMLLGRSRS